MVIEFVADEQSSSGVCNIGKFNYYLGLLILLID